MLVSGIQQSDIYVCVCVSESLYGLSNGISGKEPACQCRRCRRPTFDPWVGQSPGGGQDSPLQYSCLENPVNREAWWATVHGVAKSQTQLKQLSTHTDTQTHTHTHMQTEKLKWTLWPAQYILLQTVFPYRLLQNVECSSIGYSRALLRNTL